MLAAVSVVPGSGEEIVWLPETSGLFSVKNLSLCFFSFRFLLFAIHYDGSDCCDFPVKVIRKLP